MSIFVRLNRDLSRTAADDAFLGAAELGPPRTLACMTKSGVQKADMVHNAWRPKLEVDPETYEVRADGELLTCESATILPMAQRYFLF